MKKNKIIALFVLSVFVFSIIPLYSEEEKINRSPEPYGIDEFNTWQKDLRRFEIISFGALPFVSLLSFWTYDIIRSVKHKDDSAYRPWPMKTAGASVPLSDDEQKKVFFAAIGVSIGIALIDFSYRAIKREINRKKHKKLNLNDQEPIILIPIKDGENPPKPEKGKLNNFSNENSETGENEQHTE